MLPRPGRALTAESSISPAIDKPHAEVLMDSSLEVGSSAELGVDAHTPPRPGLCEVPKEHDPPISPLELDPRKESETSSMEAGQRTRTPPDLPDELWREILRRATLETAQVFPPAASSQPPRNSFGWSCHPVFDQAHFQSLATKHSLCLVSKQFNAIAEEYLYETIHLRRPEQALQLVGRFAAFCDDPSLDVANHGTSNSSDDFSAVLQRLETGQELDLSLGFSALSLGNEQHEQPSRITPLLSKLQRILRKYTRTLIIAPQFPPFRLEEDGDFIDAALMALHSLAKACTAVTNVFLTADHTSLFHGPTYQPWVRLLAALPQANLQNLSVQDFLLGPVVWSPRLFQTQGAGSNLKTLHLDAEHPPLPHSFPHLTHLHLFSWPTASAWDLPSLTHLFIQYLPDVTATRSFWSYPPSHPRPGVNIHDVHDVAIRPNPRTYALLPPSALGATGQPEDAYGPRREKLELLHFGCDTDLGLYFPDLSARLAWLAPNLRTLEYHVVGDLPVRFDPRSLPRSLKCIKLQTLLLGGGMELPRWSEQDCMGEYTHETLGAIEEYWKDRLTPEAVRRWSQVCAHLRAFGDDQVKPMVFFPKNTTSLPRSRFL